MLVHEMIVLVVWVKLFIGSLVAAVFVHIRCKNRYNYHILKLSTIGFVAVFVVVSGQNYFLPVRYSRPRFMYFLLTQGFSSDLWGTCIVLLLDMLVFVGMCIFFSKRTGKLIGIATSIVLWILVTQIVIAAMSFWELFLSV